MIALAVGGSAATYMGAEENRKTQTRALASAAETENKIGKAANERTQEYVQDTFDPTQRLQNYEATAAGTEKSLGELLAQLSEGGKGDVTQSTAGATSDAYARKKAEATATTTDKSRTLAKLLSRSGATGNLFGKEALAGADYSSDMLGFGADSRYNQNGLQVGLSQAGNAGNGWQLAGGLLSGAGQAYGSTKKNPGYSGTQAPAPVVDYSTRSGG